MSRWNKALASTAIAVAVAAGVWMGTGAPAISGGETRTISLHHLHTGESLTVTYMVNGRYVPSAMKKINYLLRDWRRNEVITIDPKTIDLVWELHADLGSKAPVNIVCGYRSAKTNSFLKHIGRNVAKKSQHILGKAIDLSFPDVATIKIRNSALVRQVGGVGYYTGRSGFLHVDSGRVRHWGPGIGAREMARIFRDYRKTIGARLNGRDQVMVADSSANSNAPSQQDLKAVAAAEAAEEGDSDAMAKLSAKASAMPEPAKVKPADDAQTASADPVPRPRPKPIEVLMLAAVNNMKIEPASAPPPTLVEKHAQVAQSEGAVEAAGTMVELSETAPAADADSKGSLAVALLDGTAAGVPQIREINDGKASSDLFWWPTQYVFNADQAVRRDGAPQNFGEELASMLPGSADAAEPPPAPRLVVASMPSIASGKSDMLVVDRSGKGDLPVGISVSAQKRLTVGELESQ